jgi:Ca2+-binding RTX toxin-like protein
VNGGAGRDRLIIDYSAATEGVGTSSGPSGSLENGYGGQYTDNTGARFVTYSGIEDFTIITGSGNDSITTGDGDDVVNTGAGNDFVNFGSGNDSGDGGEGVDGFSANRSAATAAILINLQTGQSGSFSNFEYLGTLTTGSGDDVIVTRDVNANETINTGEGQDTITVVRGNDSVAAGGGTDRLIVDYSAATEAVVTSSGPGGSLATGYSGQYTDQTGSRSITYSGVEHFTITTGSGGDNITTGDGDDVVNTGAGDDFVNFGSGNDAGDGGEGEDGFSANLAAATAAITINLQTGQSETFSNFEYLRTLTTGSGDDIIVTRDLNRDETINTGDGQDTITVIRGNDSVAAGGGTDRLIVDYSAATAGVTTASGPGGSLATGYSGQYTDQSGSRSISYSGIEHFTITTGSGGDNITTGDGDDIVDTGAGDDLVNVGSGNDRADGGNNADGTRGLDRITVDLATLADGSVDATAVNWNLEANTYSGPGGVNAFTNFEYFGTVTTGSGGDTIVTRNTNHDETINTGGGDDTITVFRGNDTVAAGANTDRLIIDYSGATEGVGTSSGPSGSLATGYSGQYTDQSGSRSITYSGVEHFTITTGSGNDSITTGDGDDVVNTGAGNDFVNFGSGNDSGDGGEGVDGFSANLSSATAAITINLQTGQSGTFSNFEYLGTLTTGGFHDIVVTAGINRDETINTGTGNDTVTVVRGNDVVNGGGGTDHLIIDYSAATAAVTTVTGPTASQVSQFSFSGLYTDSSGSRSISYSNIEQFTITTGSSGDNISTGAGDDVISTNAGNDTVNAGGGNDIVDGGTGDDNLNGGTGNDTVSYASLGVGAGVTVNLATTAQQNTGGGGFDTLSGFENILGSQNGDTLTGDGNANVIDGGLGDDILNGAGGIDTLSYASLTGGVGVMVSLAVTTAQNTGGAGTDTISNFET